LAYISEKMKLLSVTSRPHLWDKKILLRLFWLPPPALIKAMRLNGIVKHRVEGKREATTSD
jgi:hypothetical protein